jgi:FkbM family methyltransferase
LDFVLAYNKHGAYCVPRSAMRRPASRRVLAGLVWEESTIEYMVAHCGDGDVVTAGTFFGDFLPPLSRALAPRATLWAFEPNPESYRCAAVTVLINDLKNVKLVHGALGEKRGQGELIVSNFDGQALGGISQMKGIVDQDGARGEHALPVDVIAIDEVVPASAQVSVLQLDVEGAEELALTGAIATIRRSRPVLIVETLPKSGSWLAQELQSLGYDIECQLGAENTVLRSR